MIQCFAKDYCCLLEEARKQDKRAMDALTAKILQTTKKYQEFKTAGTKGTTGCEIRSVILPLLADHVLREANHYLRIMEYAQIVGIDMELCKYQELGNVRVFHIEAIQIPIVYNKYGDYDPDGLFYVLAEDAERIKREAIQKRKSDRDCGGG